MNELFTSVLQCVSGLGASALVGTALTLASVAPAAAQSSPSAAQTPPPEHTTRQLQLDATALSHLHSRISDGTLTIEGDAELSEIVVEAQIFYYDAADIVFSLEEINTEARLEAGFMGGGYSGRAPYMDVTIRVPQHFSVDVRHGDGDIQVHNLEKMLTLESGVGNIKVRDVGGVRIEHRSGGQVSTQNIQGPVRISQRN